MSDSPPEPAPAPENTVAIGAIYAREGDTITVQRVEMERAFAVWLRTMPKHLWKPYEKMLTMDPRRQRDEENRVDPCKILASFLAEKFEQVKWTASYVKSGALGSPPPWRDIDR